MKLPVNIRDEYLQDNLDKLEYLFPCKPDVRLLIGHQYRILVRQQIRCGRLDKIQQVDKLQVIDTLPHPCP